MISLMIEALYIIEGNYWEWELESGFKEAMSNLTFNGLTEILNIVAIEKYSKYSICV